MATHKGIVKIIGTIDGMTFYERDGLIRVRINNSPSRERIMTDACFKSMRENMKEFGGAAIASKAFRSSFKEIVKLCGNSYITGKVTGLFRRLNSHCEGEKGKRDFNFVKLHKFLVGFEFHSTLNFDSVYKVQLGKAVFSPDRTGVSFHIPEYRPGKLIKSPAGCTHYRLFLGIACLSNYVYDKDIDGYKATSPMFAGKGAICHSDAFALHGNVIAPADLSCSIAAVGSVPVDTSVLAAIGIVFYKKEGSQLYALNGENAAKIVAVG